MNLMQVAKCCANKVEWRCMSAIQYLDGIEHVLFRLVAVRGGHRYVTHELVLRCWAEKSSKRKHSNYIRKTQKAAQENTE